MAGETVVLGIDLEHEIFSKPDGSFMFIARIPTAPEELRLGEWVVFDDYADIVAVKAALLKLQAGADLRSV
jgi:hypothetical protein